MTASLLLRLTAALLAVALPACAGGAVHHRPDRGPGRLIAPSAIAPLGAGTAWDVLLATSVGLVVTPGPDGSPVVVTRRAGSRPQHTVLFVDGMATLDLTALRAIPARRLESIRVLDRLSDLPAAPVFGRVPTLVILVTTRPTPR